MIILTTGTIGGIISPSHLDTNPEVSTKGGKYKEGGDRDSRDHIMLEVGGSIISIMVSHSATGLISFSQTARGGLG